MSPSRRRGAGQTWRTAGIAIGCVAVLGLAVAGWNEGTPAPSSSAPDRGATLPPTSPPSEPSLEPTVPPAAADASVQPSAGSTRSPATIEPDPIPETRIATRVVVPALRIDLPVTRQTTTYPACGVAMYLTNLHQPGEGGVTYLYAHAQAGMFLPIYQESLVNDGARMLGMMVEVYTGDSLKFSYRIVEVRRHVTSLNGAFAWQGESVFLQTSEGPAATSPKLQVVAVHLSTGAVDFEAAHPPPRPVACR